jgi:hypothetical protein
MKKVLALATMSALAGFGALAGLGGGVNAANAAEADANTGYIKQYTMSYVSPSDTTRPVHKGLAPGTPVETHCMREGQLVNDSNFWFIIEKDGDVGYVHRDVISAPVDTPKC